MTNRDAYRGGLLNRALDPATQPDAIRAFLRAEEAALRRILTGGSSVVDVGCGTGRHLNGFGAMLSLGVGVDYEAAYVAEAVRTRDHDGIHFVVADGAAVPLSHAFDWAVCLTSTWGTMPEKGAVLEEMKRLAPRPGSRLITVYSPGSIEARTEWYGRLGQEVTEVTAEHIEAGGFRSEHFTEARLYEALRPCELLPLGSIGHLARV